MIIHLDLDCFFVSAERTRTPLLKNKPVVVCKSGDTKIFSPQDTKVTMTKSVGAFNSIFQHHREFKPFNKNAYKEEFVDEFSRIHGIVIAKSYEAKKFGIKTGTLLKDALKMCPKLLVVSGDHLFYQLLSVRLKEFLQTKIPVLEQYSIDEFWGDLNGYIEDENTYEFIKNLQDEILKKFDLPISIGASSTKWIAKFATDFNKPFGLTVVKKEEIREFVKNQKVEEFAGIGRALQKKLYDYRITTLGELIAAKPLIENWGRIGKDLYKRVTGEDKDAVEPFHDRSSIGISRNFAPLVDRDEAKRRVVILTRHLSHTIMRLNLSPSTFYFKIRYENGMKSKVSFSVDRMFSESFFKNLMLETFEKLDIYKQSKIHHFSINASNFVDEHSKKTFSLLHVNEDLKAKKLDEKLTLLRKKYGVDIIRSAVEKSE
ncbi:MAG: DNA polymerase IV [Campylobacteraceae bacterium]